MNGRTDIPWAEQAACRNHPHLEDCWSTSTQIQRRFAVKVCQHCPVRAECADHAVRTRETDGVWGGLIPEQLRALQRRQVPA